MTESIEEKFRQLLDKSQALDRNKHYVDFSHIWKDPSTLSDCAGLISEFLLQLNIDNKYIHYGHVDDLVLLSPDNLGGNFGIIPVTFTVAKTLGCKIAIWKEFANIEWGTSSLIGCTEKNLKCILLQDVVDEGTTALKIASHIKELNWNFILYYAAVLNTNNREMNIEKTMTEVGEILGKKPDFKFIIEF